MGMVGAAGGGAAAGGGGELGIAGMEGEGGLNQLALGAGDGGSPRSCFRPLKSPAGGRSCSPAASSSATGGTGGSGELG